MKMGETEVDLATFRAYLAGLGRSSFQPARYHLRTNNCNHFTEVVSRRLTGHGIPPEILDLPERLKANKVANLLMWVIEFLTTPRGQNL